MLPVNALHDPGLGFPESAKKIHKFRSVNKITSSIQNLAFLWNYIQLHEETKQVNRKEVQRRMSTYNALEKNVVRYCLYSVCSRNRPYLSAYLFTGNVVRWTWVSASLQILLYCNDLLCIQSGHMFLVQQADEKKFTEENKQKKKVNSKIDVKVPLKIVWHL